MNNYALPTPISSRSTTYCTNTPQRYSFFMIYASFFTKKHPLFTKWQYNPIESAFDPRSTRGRPAANPRKTNKQHNTGKCPSTAGMRIIPLNL